jgi:hypothetical protein
MRQWTQEDLNAIRTHFPLEACLPAPDLTIESGPAQAFETLYRNTLEKGPAAEVDYDLPFPKYLFLEYLAQKHAVMLHGSLLQDLVTLKPIRHSRDSREFGDQAAIYATQDPLWVLFFAVLNKSKLAGAIMNGAIQLQEEQAEIIRRYFYCLDAPSLEKNPWQPGAVYIMAGEGFDADPDLEGVRYGSYRLICTHWLKRSEVQPLARLLVEPQDFPFLDQVWGYDPEALGRRLSLESIAGWPFLSDDSIYPIRPGRTAEN